MAQTHSIRNKRGPTPIVTLTPWFFERCRAVPPDAFRLAFSAFVAQYRRLTGKTVVLDAEQLFTLEVIAKENSSALNFSTLPLPAYHLPRLTGQALCSTASFSFEEALAIAEELHSLLAQRYSTPKGT